MRLDVIGDTHGHAEALRALLRKLGYAERRGAWRHADGRRAVFLGDLVDRGPEQLATIDIARRMIEADSALVVMGNHEYNAIAFATPDPAAPGEHFRPRHGSNVRHHSTFLDAVGGADTDLHRELIAFFGTMPLWLDLDDVRIVHACWSAAAMDALRPHVDAARRLTATGLEAALTRASPAYAACEIILKGPEMTLDFSIAKGGALCAYRFDGEPDLEPSRLVWVR